VEAAGKPVVGGELVHTQQVVLRMEGTLVAVGRKAWAVAVKVERQEQEAVQIAE
jgi:hypothetical protein